MEKQDLVAVRFVANNEQYNSGEIAGFPADVAKTLVAGKKAVYLNPPAEEEKPLELVPGGNAAAGERKPIKDMTKVELVEFGVTEYGLELKESSKRDDLLAAVLEAQAAFEARLAEAAAAKATE